MYKKYRDNETRVNFIRDRVEKLNIVDDYKVFVVDLLLRKAYEYGLSDAEIEKNISTLENFLYDIGVRKPIVGMERAGGYYNSQESKIVMNEKELSSSPLILYCIFAHELYHALTANSFENLKWINSITGEYTVALNEIFVECSSTRTISDTGISKENPYYYNYTLGYNKTTFAIAMISAVYGVKERDFLKHALSGLEEVINFLCSKECIDNGSDINFLNDDSLKKHISFLERIDINLEMMHKTLYDFEKPKKIKKKEQKQLIKENQRAIVDGFLGISYNCAEMFKQRLESCKNDKEVNDSLKFSFNQMYFILESVINQYKENKVVDDVTSQMLMEEIEKQKKELFRTVSQKVGEEVGKEEACFTLTDDMLKYADIPNDKGKWDNSEIAENFKKVLEKRELLIFPNSGKNIKKYNEDEYIRYWIELYIERCNFSIEDKSVLTDILMRRAYQFNQKGPDIIKDMEFLKEHIDSIDVTIKNEGYDATERKININAKKLLKGDNKQTYKELTFQVYKFLAGRQSSKKDDIIFESILERAAHRTVYDKKKSLNPYFNSRDKNRIVDLIAITYGVPEDELLKFAIKGRDCLIQYLSQKNYESIEDTESFFEKLGTKLEIVRNLQIVKLGEIGRNKKQNDELFSEAASELINLCIKKREHLLDRAMNGEISLGEKEKSSMCEEMKFSYNGFKKFMKNHNRNIIRKNREGIKSFRDKILEAEEVIQNPLKKLYEDLGLEVPSEEFNSGITEKNTRRTKYFKLSPDFIKSMTQPQKDEPSWGKSNIYNYTGNYFIRKVLIKVRSSFTKKVKALKSGVKKELLGESQVTSTKNAQNKGFDESLNVGYTPQVSSTKKPEDNNRRRGDAEEINL